MSLDNPTWLEKRPMWQKVGAIVLLILASYALVFWWGTVKSREWADSEYLQERTERDQRLAVLAADNEALRQKNEAQAELLTQIDAKNDIQRAEDFNRLQDERKKKEDEIQNADPVASFNGLCADAQRAGFVLSICGGR